METVFSKAAEGHPRGGRVVTRMISQADVRATLDALGDTPDGIAATLAAKGVRAVCGEASMCALAEYLAEQYPGWRVSVGRTDALLWRNGYPDVLVEWGWGTALSRFVGRFDKGCYPELVAE